MKLHWSSDDENPPSKKGKGYRIEKTHVFIEQGNFRVEPGEHAYWSFLTGHRSAGDFPDTPISETLKWIIQQIALGNFFQLKEGQETVCLVIGKGAPQSFPSEEAAAEHAARNIVAIQVAGLIAEAREKGSYPQTAEFEEKFWNGPTESAKRRIELHYADFLAQLLGRISKKLPELEMLPIMEKAPEKTKEYIAEATRCCLLKMDLACIAICRACLEHGLRGGLTSSMKEELEDKIENKKRLRRPQNDLQSLIEVWADNGKLNGSFADAEVVRKAGNDVLHMKGCEDFIAWDVLRKTRKIIGIIYGRDSGKEEE
jgi:hypothetical protein